YRADSANRVHSVSFSDDEWINYIPIRMPDTICVQDRVPSGFAAVLINRTHTHKDLFLPIDPAEKKLFDAIDGQSTIGNIGERSLGGANPAKPDSLARTFFEQLWWHDQVVFDTGLTH
ncbi:MAG TPA: class I SAM-dependent methyltransferase, partial [Terriglobales bacterium]